MKKGQICEGIVDRVDFPNKGIVRIGEEAVIVKNSLPGQKIRFCVNKIKHGKAEGRLLEVIEKSPSERGETCSLFGVCGGCTYLSLSYEEQVKLKEEQVKKLLDGALCGQQDAYLWEGIKKSPVIYSYRNKMEYTFGNEVKDGPLSLGLHKRGSFYDVLNTPDCRIADQDYLCILTAVREYFAGKKIGFFHRITHLGYLRHLLIRKASKTGEILVALVTTGQIDENVESSLLNGFKECVLALQEEQKIHGKITGILHILNDSPADTIQSDRMDILYGKDCFFEELSGLRFKISAFSFFQTNSYSAEVLYRTAGEYIGAIGENMTVFDLYSGTGTIAQLMAKKAKKVVGVEIVEEAVEAARENAALNGLSNCFFLAGDVLKVLDQIPEKPDMIVLDPPRDGIHPKALPKIIAYGVERILYISCKPTSLVRDLEVFLKSGYRVVKACAVDQFPWTTHVETVVGLQRIDM